MSNGYPVFGRSESFPDSIEIDWGDGEPPIIVDGPEDPIAEGLRMRAEQNAADINAAMGEGRKRKSLIGRVRDYLGSIPSNIEEANEAFAKMVDEDPNVKPRDLYK